MLLVTYGAGELAQFLDFRVRQTLSVGQLVRQLSPALLYLGVNFARVLLCAAQESGLLLLQLTHGELALNTSLWVSSKHTTGLVERLSELLGVVFPNALAVDAQTLVDAGLQRVEWRGCGRSRRWRSKVKLTFIHGAWATNTAERTERTADQAANHNGVQTTGCNFLWGEVIAHAHFELVLDQLRTGFADGRQTASLSCAGKQVARELRRSAESATNRRRHERFSRTIDRSTEHGTVGRGIAAFDRFAVERTVA